MIVIEYIYIYTHWESFVNLSLPLEDNLYIAGSVVVELYLTTVYDSIIKQDVISHFELPDKTEPSG